MREMQFVHPLGGIVDLPLLVPSYSSKGFDYFREKNGQNQKHRYSITTFALEDYVRYQQESYLLSAYDIHHEHFRQPDRFYNNTSLIFLDSGGYELNPEFDSSEPKLTPKLNAKFSRDNYVDTLARLYKDHSDCPFAIANYDWGTKNKPFERQIEDAHLIFDACPNWATNFILKPCTRRGKVVKVDDLIPEIEELRRFNIIGVTEKELGKNLMDRLKEIAKLRVELNRRKIRAPIHIWGGLDPMITPVYFFAGADIFDGVSWLRYAFSDGVAVNRESYSILTGKPTLSSDHAIAMALNNNLITLQGIATGLRTFASSDTPNFKMFESKGDILEKTYLCMMAKIPEMRELYNGR